MLSFYLIMYARSVKNSFFRIDINSMSFHSDYENTSISEFEAKYDDKNPKLFK